MSDKQKPKVHVAAAAATGYWNHSLNALAVRCIDFCHPTNGVNNRPSYNNN